MIPFYSDINPIGFASSIAVVMIAGGATMARADEIQTITNSEYFAIGELKSIPKTIYHTLTNTNLDIEPALPSIRNLPEAKTSFGRKLLEHRKQILDQGMPLLSIHEINEIVREARRNV